MGPHCSTVCSKIMTDKLPPSLLFYDFNSNVKYKYSSINFLARKFRSNLKYPPECDVETMEVIVHLWCINSMTTSKWQHFSRRLKNKIIHDFLNTLYCTSHAFDEIFVLLFTNSKSRSFLLGNQGQQIPPDGLRNIVDDILMYSSFAGLKYNTLINEQNSLEAIVDFPLKSFSLCPCTKRPLYVAIYLSRPDIVHLLLKNGARIPYEDVCNCMGDLRHPLRNVMDILKVTYDRKIEDDSSKSIAVRTEKNVLSLKLILVDVNHSSSLWTNIWDIVCKLTETENYENIPSLKHIARTKIRHIIRGNACFCHPRIWEVLCLPQTLISYMNLDEYLV